MMDENLKPWLLEVNTSPSLSSSSPLDKMMKTSLVSDVFSMIGIKVKPSVKYIKEVASEKIPNKANTDKKKSQARSKEWNISKTKRKDSNQNQLVKVKPDMKAK